MVVEIRDIEGQLIKMRDKMVEDLDLKEPALPVDTQPTIKVAQLRRIVALDTVSAVFYPFAEIQHVVWSIAIATGLRPSSFGGKPKSPQAASTQPPHLIWSDIEFRRIRTQTAGHFTVRLNIRNLKGVTRVCSSAPEELIFNLETPAKASNLALSVPHRLLVIALRRGALELETLDELIDGQLMLIKVKNEFLDMPVLV